jgi:hypothetical protein
MKKTQTCKYVAQENGFGPAYLERMLSPGIAAVNLLLENVINMI